MITPIRRTKSLTPEILLGTCTNLCSGSWNLTKVVTLCSFCTDMEKPPNQWSGGHPIA